MTTKCINLTQLQKDNFNTLTEICCTITVTVQFNTLIFL